MNNKKIHIEICRIIAALFVSFQHSVFRGATLYTYYTPYELRTYIYMLIKIISVTSVPLFFMISGANLLGKDETIKKQIERFIKIALVLIVFEIAYFCENVLVYGDGEFTIKHFLINFYTSEKNAFHLWYLCAYLCFLMILPFIKMIARSLDNKHFLYLCVLALFFNGAIPLVESLVFKGKITLYSQFIPTSLLSNIILWPIIGYKIENIEVKRVDYLRLFVGTIVCWNIMILSELYLWRRNGGCIGEFSSWFLILSAPFIYLTIKKICGKINMSTTIKKIIVAIGSTTFGTYLIHIRMMHKMWNNYDYVYQVIQEPMLACILWLISVQAVSVIIILVLRKIKFVRYFI